MRTSLINLYDFYWATYRALSMICYTWEESHLVTECVGLAKSSLSLEVLNEMKKHNLQLHYISDQLNAGSCT
jgi:hypothetical protein